MAKRCLEHFSLESTQYDFMTFGDLSFLVDNPYYGTNVGNQDSKVSSYGTNICQIHLSDSSYIHAMDGTSAIFHKELSTSYSGYTNFNLWLNKIDTVDLSTIVISSGMLTSQVSSNDVRWAVILDDAEKTGWVVCRHVDTNCYVCGGDNDTGRMIYYAYMYGEISPSGGAGSGYIGNSLVSNKKMIGYNVPTSSSESTKTESVNEASANPVSGKPKAGNGFAKIKLVRELNWHTIYENGNILEPSMFTLDHTDDVSSGMSESYIHFNDTDIEMYAYRSNGGSSSYAWFVFNNSPLPSSLKKIRVNLSVTPGCGSWGTVGYGFGNTSVQLKALPPHFRNGDCPIYDDGYIGYSDGQMYFPDTDTRDYEVTMDYVLGNTFSFCLHIMNIAYLTVKINKIEYLY